MNRVVALGAVSIVLLASVAQADQHVDQKDKAFSSQSVDASVGEGVTFSNTDSVTHDLSIRNPDGSKMESVMERPGDTHTVRFDHPGQYHVDCIIHPKMKMTVNVH